jgi:uncharacterized protein (DUF1919 family)
VINAFCIGSHVHEKFKLQTRSNFLDVYTAESDDFLLAEVRTDGSKLRVVEKC